MSKYTEIAIVTTAVIVIALSIIGLFILFVNDMKQEIPPVGTAIGTQTVYVLPTESEMTCIDTSGTELETSDELIVSFPYVPCTSVTFDDNAGVLSWDKGVITFEGDMDASARIFFDYFLKPLIHDYIKEELVK